MRFVLSSVDGVGASLDGWTAVVVPEDSSVDAVARTREELTRRPGQIDEVLVIACLERLGRSVAVSFLEMLGEVVPEGARITLVVADAETAFSTTDDGEASADDLTEWYDTAFGSTVDPWCAGPADLRRLVAEVGLGALEPSSVPAGFPPGLTWWVSAQEVVRGRGATQVPDRGERAETKRRLRRLADERNSQRTTAASAELAGPPPPRSRLRELIDRFLPRGGRRRAAARASVDALRETQDYVDRVRTIVAASGLHEPREPSYRRWSHDHRATTSDCNDQRHLSETARDPVTVTCIVLARGSWTDVQATLRSLNHQTWSHWRAVVVGRWQPRLGRDDARVKYVRSDATDAAELVNAVLDEPDPRSLVLVLEAGDKLSRDACFHIANAAGTDPLVDLVYWDDDVITGDRTSDPQFRPSWSPEMLLGANYLGRSFALRHRVLAGLTGMRTGFGEDAWWDLALRADLEAEQVARIPRVLEHLRERPSAIGPRGVDVVDEHLRRVGIPASAIAAQGCVRIAWHDDELPHVTVIMPTRHNTEMLQRSLGTLRDTSYPSFDVIVVDNGGRTDERASWYEEHFGDLDLTVEWWSDDFNYSAVNNAAAAKARGEVLVFLNDDTELREPDWLHEMVGWARRPEIGVVGLQLLDEAGSIQHGGVILGLNGFADHLFEGMEPGSPSLLGPTSWYRNTLSVTAACLAIRRPLFEDLGGFDERFVLCGSDVVLGLDALLAGKRNVVSPFGGVRHLESATRGTHVPPEDFFASFWRYQRWMFSGDPYFSPNLSLGSRVPRLRARYEQSAADRIAEPLNRQITIFRQTTAESEIDPVVRGCRATDVDVEKVRELHAHNVEPFEPKTINWFLPELDSPFYGGINTALRIADHLDRVHGVENRFVLWAHPNDGFHRSAIAAAFPGLADSSIYYDLSLRAAAGIPAADITISTLWVTAYAAAHFPNTRRKFYLVQDFEPMFYPAGTMYALAEESYRLGLYGLCNTSNLLELYERYGGTGMSFKPAVDRQVFHAVGRRRRRDGDPVTVFVYARPGHWRNCWELASLALEELKEHLGDQVRIVTAGSWARPEDVGTGIQHLGLLDYRETGNLYRTCDVGVALTVSEHPSYLPLELMACGVPVVAFDNPAGYWLLRDGENCLLARRTVDDLSKRLSRIVVDHDLRESLAQQGLRDIDEGYASWDKSLSGIYEYLCDPEGLARS